jgi:hypothetical protein
VTLSAGASKGGVEWQGFVKEGGARPAICAASPACAQKWGARLGLADAEMSKRPPDARAPAAAEAMTDARLTDARQDS